MQGPPRINDYVAPFPSRQTPLDAAFERDSDIEIYNKFRSGRYARVGDPALRGRFVVEWRGLTYTQASRILYELRDGQCTFTPRTNVGNGGGVDVDDDGIVEVILKEVALPCRVVGPLPSSTALNRRFASGEQEATLRVELETLDTYSRFPGFGVPATFGFTFEAQQGQTLRVDLQGPSASAVTGFTVVDTATDTIIYEEAGSVLEVTTFPFQSGPYLVEARTGQKDFSGIERMDVDGSVETAALNGVDWSKFPDLEIMRIEAGTPVLTSFPDTLQDLTLAYGAVADVGALPEGLLEIGDFGSSGYIGNINSYPTTVERVGISKSATSVPDGVAAGQNFPSLIALNASYSDTRWDLSSDWSEAAIETFIATNSTVGNPVNLLLQNPSIEVFQGSAERDKDGDPIAPDLRNISAETNPNLKRIFVQSQSNNISHLFTDPEFAKQFELIGLDTYGGFYTVTTNAGGDTIPAQSFGWNRLLGAIHIEAYGGDPVGGTPTGAYAALEINCGVKEGNFQNPPSARAAPPTYEHTAPDGSTTYDPGDGRGDRVRRNYLHPETVERIFGSALYEGKGYTCDLRDGSTYTYGEKGYQPLYTELAAISARQILYGYTLP